MLNDIEIKEFADFIKECYVKKANELVDSLELVNLILDDIYDLIKKDFDKNYQEQKSGNQSSC